MSIQYKRNYYSTYQQCTLPLAPTARRRPSNGLQLDPASTMPTYPIITFLARARASVDVVRRPPQRHMHHRDIMSEPVHMIVHHHVLVIMSSSSKHLNLLFRHRHCHAAPRVRVYNQNRSAPQRPSERPWTMRAGRRWDGLAGRGSAVHWRPHR